MRFILNEADNDQHIYVDSATGKTYIFDGIALREVGISKPSIGDRGDTDSDIRKKEEEERQKEAEKEKGKDGDDESDPEAVKARLARIKKNLEDDSVADSAEAETDAVIDKDIKKAKQKEAQKYRSNPSNKFKMDIRRFIARQVQDLRDRSWKKFDKNSSAFGIMKQGWTNTPNGKIPIINVYYDQSGSWGPDDIKVGDSMLAVLGEFEKKRQIKVNVFYFANHVSPDLNTVLQSRGTGAGDEIMNHIRSTKPDNVVVMTDSDLYGSPTSIEVPGAVWFLWKQGQQDSWLKSSLKGRMETQSYNI